VRVVTQPSSARSTVANWFLAAQAVVRKLWELPDALSLIRLWQRRSKHSEARQMLSEIHGWFAEGFDTADLQEAKALLAQLS
jgi:predicted ATPase